MRKNDKIKITLFLLILVTLITWFVAGGTFDAGGQFSQAEITRMGIYDIFIATMYSIYYKIADVYYLFALGIFYAVLSKTKFYSVLVDKLVSKIKDKEHIFILSSTFIVAIITSLTNNILIPFAFVPFIITVMLKCGKSRTLAIATGLGGIFIGIAGLTFGTYGVKNLMDAAKLKYVQGIGFKIALFVISYILYNLYTIISLNKQYKDVDETKYDLFLPEKYEEPKRKSKRIAIWPSLTMLIILIIVLIISYIDWQSSFRVNLFTKIENGFESLSIRGIPILFNLVGSVKAFGSITDSLAGATYLLITSFVIGLFNKMSLDDYFDNIKDGISKMSKIVLLYVLIYSIFTIIMWDGWPTSIIHLLIGNGKFNMFKVLIIGIVCSFFFLENNYTGYVLGEFVASSYSNKIVPAILLLNSSSALVMTFAPTSIILMITLALLDLPYKDWLKFIWKYTISLLIAILIVFSIICYM